MIKINENSKIYVLCPAGYASGGPEALHQLVYYMKKSGYKNVYITYFNHAKGRKTETPERYKKYCSEFLLEEDVEDDPNNLLILPESRSIKSFNYHQIQKCIWWLSIYYRDRKEWSLKNIALAIMQSVKHFTLKPVKKILSEHKNMKYQDIGYHFVGSKYAYEYLTKKRKLTNVKYLVEPISKEFLDAGRFEDISGRENTVLYNPAKPSKIMKRLLKNSSFGKLNISFKAIKGYTVNELIELYRKTKVYVDFGAFGGPERIPKETVYNGCAILVANRNAAKNDFDVAIPNRFKINKFNSYSLVVKSIEDALQNYETIQCEFEGFREKTGNLESNFLAQIKDCFEISEN